MDGRDRRTVLTLGLGALAAAGAAPARALSLVEASAHLEAAARDRCNLIADHRAFWTEVEAMLAGTKLSEDERQAILAALQCPVCGCSVSASRD